MPLRRFRNRNVDPNRGRTSREERLGIEHGRRYRRPPGTEPERIGDPFGREGRSHRERAVLFGAVFPEEQSPHEAPLTELERLAETAGALVASKLTQRREQPHSSTFVGPGFVETVRECAERTAADLLIADNELSPSQAFNIEKRAGRRVIDRAELILDIFAAHARSREAKTAVELAQLEYALPRLKRLWTHLERQRGGIGLRGPGEAQIETDRRLVKKRIAELRRVLKQIQERKQRELKARGEIFTVALVGYTNAGKSTLLNALCGLEQKTADQLFATLDTKTALLDLGRPFRALLTDTVGFIQKIPHHLIASFHATLAEVKEADLLLHVVDASHPEAERHIEAVLEVLQQIGAAERPRLLLFNKVDLLADAMHLAHLRRRFPGALEISARTGAGLEILRECVIAAMRARMQRVRVELPVAAGAAIAYVHQHAEVIEEHYDERGAVIEARIEPRDLGPLEGMLGESGRIEVLGPAVPPALAPGELAPPPATAAMPTTPA
ncbi:MAG: GTPase HflX [Planctomycetota bacterium]|nr:MAG: GTPase HflX [Planctomycetota bacterium]